MGSLIPFNENMCINQGRMVSASFVSQSSLVWDILFISIFCLFLIHWVDFFHSILLFCFACGLLNWDWMAARYDHYYCFCKALNLISVDSRVVSDSCASSLLSFALYYGYGNNLKWKTAQVKLISWYFSIRVPDVKLRVWPSVILWSPWSLYVGENMIPHAGCLMTDFMMWFEYGI